MASSTNVEKIIFDVNILAIFLVKSHPGFEHITPIIEEGLRGAYTPIIMDTLPTRAYCIMTRRWGLPEKESAAAIKHFVKTYDHPHYTNLKRETILHSFHLSERLHHEVFDCTYIALAHQEKATAILTTDTDFERLCKHANIKYINPVPKETLKHFKEQNTPTPTT